MRLFRFLLVALPSVVALKGSASSAERRQLRRLQPAAPLPKEGGGTDPKAPPGADGVAPKEVAPKEVAPKEVAPKDPKAVDPKTPPEPKADGLAPKKQKKCKKAPKVDLSAESAPAVSPNDAPDASPIVAHEHNDDHDDEPYCLQGDATAEECSAAKGGKLPKGHPSIKGDVQLRISYVQGSSATDVLSKVEDVIRSETAAEFIGCDNGVGSARSPSSGGTGSEETTPAQEPVEPVPAEDLRVTGVDFQKVKIANEGTFVCG
jgi:hypothetical protein